MSKVKKYSLKPSSFQAFSRKCTIVLAVFFAILFGLYLWNGSRVRDDLSRQIQPVVQEFKEQYGANSVGVRIKAEPDSSDVPSELEFHIFLTVHYSDLRAMDEDQALSILRNGDKKGSTEYSYDGDAMDFAIYTRKVTDSVHGNDHPVFVTLTDGDLDYCLYNENTYRGNSRLRKYDAYQRLRAPGTHMGQTLSMWIVILCVYGLVNSAVRESKRKQAVQEEAKKFYRACRDGGVDPDTGDGAKRALEAGKQCGSADVIKKFDRDWKILYQMGSDAVASQSFTSMEDIPAGRGMESILSRVEALVAEEQVLLQREQKKAKRFTLLGILAAAALAAVLVLVLLLKPMGSYKEAEALLAAGDADGAYLIFEDLGGFMDSREKCNAIDYDRAAALEEKGQISRAYQAFAALGDYGDAQQRKTALENAHPYLAVLLAQEGDIVTLGRYEQDNDTANGPEDIEWIVLNNGGGRAFLVSRYVLDARRYSEDKTDGLDLETWLSTSFAETAFAGAEPGVISNVTLLQRQDVDNYKLSDGAFTAYAKAQGPERAYDGNYWWWLYGITTSYGGRDGYALKEGATYVTNNISDVDDVNGVRPAIWLFGGSEESADQNDSVSDSAAVATEPVPEETVAADEIPAEAEG